MNVLQEITFAKEPFAPNSKIVFLSDDESLAHLKTREVFPGEIHQGRLDLFGFWTNVADRVYYVKYEKLTPGVAASLSMHISKIFIGEICDFIMNAKMWIVDQEINQNFFEEPNTNPYVQ
jgi:hypothetical protein